MATADLDTTVDPMELTVQCDPMVDRLREVVGTVSGMVINLGATKLSVGPADIYSDGYVPVTVTDSENRVWSLISESEDGAVLFFTAPRSI